MSAFEYKAFDAKGKELSGIIDADNAKVARAQLKKQGLFPSEISEQKSGQITKGQGLNVQIDVGKLFQRVSAQELSEFTSQLETLFRTGVDVAESLQILSEQTDNEMMRLALVEIRDEVRQGKALSEAMKLHPKIFNNLYISMVEVGQESGNMDQVLARLKEYTQKMVELRQKVISSMTYPALMGLISIGVVLALFIGVIPRIRKMFDSFGATLPLLTRVMLGLSDFLVHRWYFIAILVAGIFYGFRKWIESEEGRMRFDRFKLEIPIFGKLNRMIAISRFSRTLATLLRSGIPMAEALGTAKNVVGNKVLEEAIEDATQNIIKGHNFADPLAASGQFPPLVVRMIGIGERTGEMEQMLLEASDTYDQRVDAQLSSLTSILEPILIVGLGGVVVLVALSILLPMLNMTAIAR
jgi:general secretion pathway protein F